MGALPRHDHLGRRERVVVVLDRHDTVFFADVSGPLDRVLAYDAAGELLEEHEILPCSGAADCEIR